jgi:hypothetical protein
MITRPRQRPTIGVEVILAGNPHGGTDDALVGHDHAAFG